MNRGLKRKRWPIVLSLLLVFQLLLTGTTRASESKSDPRTVTADLTATLKSKLRDGANVLAAEVHQGSAGSSDLYRDMKLVANPDDSGSDGNPRSGKPTAIALTYYDDPKTSMAFAWYTSDKITGTQVQVVEASKLNGNSFPPTGVQTYQGASQVISVYLTLADKSNDMSTSFSSHKAIADGLKPGTAYAYRLGDGTAGNWSDIGTFTTEPASDNGFTFLYTTDSQAKTQADYTIWKNTVQQGIQTFPDAKFIVNTGDLVDNGDVEEQWMWLLNEPKDLLSRIPLMPILGNHETQNYNNFAYHFHLPNKSQTDATPEGSVYAFDYGPAHFMVFNTQYSGSSDPVFKKQVEWLRNEVAKTDKKWKIVLSHKSIYSVASHSGSRDVKFFREHLAPLFDELGIDAVLSGHDHTYTRSYQMYAGQPQEVTEDGEGHVLNPKGTVYFVGNTAGPKFYKPKAQGFPYAAVSGQPKKQMFTGVTVQDDTLTFQAYTTTKGGSTERYDAYNIKKTTAKPNKVENAKATLTADGKVKLTWTAPGTGPAVEGYRIYEQNDALGPNWTAKVRHADGTTTYSYTVATKNPSPSYRFVIKAVSGRLNSDPVVAEYAAGKREPAAVRTVPGMP
ncbi:metallophosphoesterase [Paenibacillus sp. MZ04-78.2]|uniref:purple acid phosphatase family protein n=1 Tax=Paenibacillus sp. MZ04-78.2 TaxID=2962034 RepID=UPI0020B68E1C|nr:metallophosphoesterase [Paenibacillus sp. MZ04-78.2]MCP3773114.1 metallophosphoesterase [Paenibacillus sp. MZ04-78.2]